MDDKFGTPSHDEKLGPEGMFRHDQDSAPGIASPPPKPPNKYRKKHPHGRIRLNMAPVNHSAAANHPDLSIQVNVSSDSDDEDDDELAPPSSQDASSGIDIDTIKSAKKVKHSIAHRVEAEQSILALVVDDDYLIAGLEGGDLVVCASFCVLCQQRKNSNNLTLQVWSLETFEKAYTVHAHAESVLSLYLSEDKQLLFSSGVDSVVNVQPFSLSLLLSLNLLGLVYPRPITTVLHSFAS